MADDRSTDAVLARLATAERELARLRGHEGRRARHRCGQALIPALALALLLALLPAALGAAVAFNDLNTGSPHNGNIQAIANAGITLGCDPGVAYCPNGAVTREEMASFLARTAGLGGNPPVANALTAQTVPDHSVVAAKLSAVGAAPGQVLTATGVGVAWQSPPPGSTGMTKLTHRSRMSEVPSGGSFTERFAPCAAGEKVTGGGYGGTVAFGIIASHPYTGENVESWRVVVNNTTAAPKTFTVYAICAAP